MQFCCSLDLDWLDVCHGCHSNGRASEELPGVVQLDLPIGAILNQSCVREQSVTQAAIGCHGILK